MRRRSKHCPYSRKPFILLLSLALISLALLRLPLFHSGPQSVQIPVDSSYKQRVHSFVRKVLSKQCQPFFARQKMEAVHQGSSPVPKPFLDKNTDLNEQIFKYPPPFGFLNLQHELQEVLKLLPDLSEERSERNGCQRCVVVGNGGILRGLELGHLLDQFNIVIRLNSGPVRGFSADVGNRTSIRMSYPEGCPKRWEDPDSSAKFVAVVYKSVDFHWLQAMITQTSVSLWDWLFFWQKVPVQVPVQSSQFRLLNPEIIRETALDLLQYPTPRPRLWGWDQNVPTLGVSALNLATYMCDEVSVAGFGYNLSQKAAPLHYYDQMPMTSMLKEGMHNLETERELLKRLLSSDVITDLTGAIQCSFC